MITLADLSAWTKLRAQIKEGVGFVPTMGALHQGHISLLQQSVTENPVTVLSIYVNATQFNDATDLDRYPSSLQDDLVLAEQAGVDYVLLPDYAQMYPDSFRYQIHENDLSAMLCGADRPGHFAGVLTVVMKLLNLVRPSKAYFGLKDFQQYQLIRDMCAAFFMPVNIIGCPIVREADGLAMSSRNRRLNPQARALASNFNKILQTAPTDESAALALTAAGLQVGYVATHGARRCAAVTVMSDDDPVRLIDNVGLDGREAS